MTGKQQKERNELKEIKKRLELTTEERQKIMDEAVAEVHAANAEFLERFKMPLKAFRGMYQVHILFNMINELVNRKIEKIVDTRINEYLEEQKTSKRKKI